MTRGDCVPSLLTSRPTPPDTATPGLAPRPSAPEPISRYYIKEMKSNAWKVTSVGAAEQHMFIRYDYITLMLALIRGCRSPNKRKTTTKKGGKSVNVLKR